MFKQCYKIILYILKIYQLLACPLKSIHECFRIHLREKAISLDVLAMSKQLKNVLTEGQFCESGRAYFVNTLHVGSKCVGDCIKLLQMQIGRYQKQCYPLKRPFRDGHKKDIC